MFIVFSGNRRVHQPPPNETRLFWSCRLPACHRRSTSSPPGNTTDHRQNSLVQKWFECFFLMNTFFSFGFPILWEYQNPESTLFFTWSGNHSHWNKFNIIDLKKSVTNNRFALMKRSFHWRFSILNRCVISSLCRPVYFRSSISEKSLRDSTMPTPSPTPLPKCSIVSVLR